MRSARRSPHEPAGRARLAERAAWIEHDDLGYAARSAIAPYPRSRFTTTEQFKKEQAPSHEPAFRSAGGLARSQVAPARSLEKFPAPVPSSIAAPEDGRTPFPSLRFTVPWRAKPSGILASHRLASCLAGLALAVVTVLLAPPARACATCFGQSDSPLAEGMNMGILFLLGTIVTVLAAFASFFVFLARRSAVLAAAASSATVPGTGTAAS